MRRYLPLLILPLLLVATQSQAQDASRRNAARRPPAQEFDHWQRAQDIHVFTTTYLLSPWHSYYAFSHDGSTTYEWFDASQIYADAAMIQYGDDSYIPYMNNTYYNFMYVFWDFGSPIGGYFAAAASDGSWVATDRKYVDDNALTAVAYMDAYEATGDVNYLYSAQAIANYLMFSGLWTSESGGGFQWNTVETFKPTQANGLAIQMFLKLYQHTGASYYMDWANSIKNWLDANMYDSTQNLYVWRSDNKTIMFTYDQAIMIEANLLFYDITHKNKYLKAAQKLARNMHRLLWNDLEGGYFIHSSEADGGHILSPTLSGWASQSLIRLYEHDGKEKWLRRARINVDFFNRFGYDPTWLGYWGNNGPDGTITGWFFQTVDQAWMQRTQGMLGQYDNICIRGKGRGLDRDDDGENERDFRFPDRGRGRHCN